jgi:mannose-6-phosphate isomerase-like protein (cupin superfamily)
MSYEEPTSSFEKLRGISTDILDKLKKTPAEEHSRLLSFQDYHGFSKTRLPDDVLEEVLSGAGLTNEQLQVEIVGVNSDLTHEVHLHKESDAYVIVLGRGTNFEGPKNAKQFQGGKWIEVSENQEIQIPKGTPHGFTVEDGGVLYFLSLQLPPIVDEQGDDDYVPVGK